MRLALLAGRKPHFQPNQGKYPGAHSSLAIDNEEGHARPSLKASGESFWLWTLSYRQTPGTAELMI